MLLSIALELYLVHLVLCISAQAAVIRVIGDGRIALDNNPDERARRRPLQPHQNCRAQRCRIPKPTCATGLRERAGQKIVGERQFADLGMQRLHVDRGRHPEAAFSRP